MNRYEYRYVASSTPRRHAVLLVAYPVGQDRARLLARCLARDFLMVRYIVVGVGAIGGTVCGKLWKTGCDVACCARGPPHHPSAFGA